MYLEHLSARVLIGFQNSYLRFRSNSILPENGHGKLIFQGTRKGVIWILNPFLKTKRVFTLAYCLYPCRILMEQGKHVF